MPIRKALGCAELWNVRLVERACEGIGKIKLPAWNYCEFLCHVVGSTTTAAYGRHRMLSAEVPREVRIVCQLILALTLSTNLTYRMT